VEVVRRLLAVQAQDPRSARLALRARSAGLTSAGVDRALGEDRSLLVAWLCRGTVHLVAREDYPWLLALTAPARFANSRRRLDQEGVAPAEAERAVETIERALAEEGPLTRAELGERIAAKGIPTEGQATPHLLMLASLSGIAVRGPLRGGEQAFALTRDWLGIEPPGELTGDERAGALAELARRYLAAHGPAAAADLATWAGIGLWDARAGLAAIAAELVEVGELVDLADREPRAEPIPARLLASFDPYLLGWRDRAFAVPAEHAKRVQPGGGIVRAAATIDGVAVGTWKARRRDERIAVELEPFGELHPDAETALDEEIADIARFEGRTVPSRPG